MAKEKGSFFFFYPVDRGKINTVWVLWFDNGLVSANQMLDNSILFAKFAGQLLAKQEAKPQTLEVLMLKLKTTGPKPMTVQPSITLDPVKKIVMMYQQVAHPSLQHPL